MLQVRHPRQKLAIAALAFGFWGQVLLLRGFIHQPSTPRLVLTGAEVPRPAFEQLETPREGHTIPVPGPRLDPSEADLHLVIRAAVPAIRAHAAALPRVGRFEVKLAISARGRVSRVSIDATPSLSHAGRRVIERALRAVPFPQRGEDYTAEFPIIVQRAP